MKFNDPMNQFQYELAELRRDHEPEDDEVKILAYEIAGGYNQTFNVLYNDYIQSRRPKPLRQEPTEHHDDGAKNSGEPAAIDNETGESEHLTLGQPIQDDYYPTNTPPAAPPAPTMPPTQPPAAPVDKKPEDMGTRIGPVEFNMADIDPSITNKPRNWIWGRVLGHQDIMAITGLSGSGKSISVAEIACAAASGGKALGRKFTRKLRVRIFDPELDAEDAARRMMQVLKKTDSLAYMSSIDVTCSNVSPLNLGGIEQKLANYKAEGKEYDLIILDSVSITLGHSGFDENVNHDVLEFLSMLKQICVRFGVACVVMLHPPKNAGQAVQNAGMLARGAEAWRAHVDTMAEFRPLRIEKDTPAWDIQKLKSYQDYDEDGKLETIYPRAFRLVVVKWRHSHRPKTINMFLRYPIHEVDETGELAECKEDFNTSYEIGGQHTKEKFEQVKVEEVEKIREIIDQMHEEGKKATREEVRQRLNEWRESLGMDVIKKTTFETYTKGKNRRLPFKVYGGELTYIPSDDEGEREDEVDAA